MNIYKIDNIGELIHDNSYVGRGIVIGQTKDAKKQQLHISLWEEVKTAVTVFFVRRIWMLPFILMTNPR